MQDMQKLTWEGLALVPELVTHRPRQRARSRMYRCRRDYGENRIKRI